ncbi:MAG TPA: efflux RND transporter periplasmic adaptor subunit [Aquabacterium sp.]|uniref:efflux RND transporter periplasmic adaptor subunit n=1 Tax=Aquabacterium sp. TaxID=1872578 RepID=UPI002E381F36|nr:efflux RND transporter periplasmic adaptor subunit [Aquabacterium sp.]HEX5355300.1 efflux RND transporter periplasmic adaptor subunit [Aquabacterium sp.]
MTADVPAAAQSALSKLKIDRGTQASAKKKKSILPWVLIGAVAAAAAAYFLVPRTADVSTTSVVMSTPSQQYVQLTASGYVVAQRRSAVASKASGRLIELNVREGSHVKKDDLIARLDASDIKAGILGAEAAVHQAEANVKQSTVQLIQARADLARARSLEAQGFVSPQTVENALAKNKAAFAAVAAAEAAMEQAKAQLKAQKVAQDYTEIRAPFDGVVLVKNANVGDIITPMSSAAGAQGAVVTMADMTTLEVEADVSEGNLSKTKVGQPVEVTLDALPTARFRGHVAGIVPTVDRAKATVMTKIKFDQLDPRVLPEMSAKVSFLSQDITPADQEPVLAVTNSAMVSRDSGNVVYRIKPVEGGGNIVEEVPVKALRKLGDLREISGNVKAGEKLVATPPASLRNGARVNLGTP